jgi:hypothetical protein
MASCWAIRGRISHDALSAAGRGVGSDEGEGAVGQQPGLAAVHHFFAVVAGEGFIDHIGVPQVVLLVGKIQVSALGVAGGHGQPGDGDAPGDDGVDLPEEAVQVGSLVGGFGDGVGGGLPFLGTLLAGDVTGHADAQLVGSRPAG